MAAQTLASPRACAHTPTHTRLHAVHIIKGRRLAQAIREGPGYVMTMDKSNQASIDRYECRDTAAFCALSANY